MDNLSQRIAFLADGKVLKKTLDRITTLLLQHVMNKNYNRLKLLKALKKLLNARI